MLENDEYEVLMSKTLEFAEQGKYDMYSYAAIYSNLLFHIKIESLDISKEDLICRLSNGLEISKSHSDWNPTLMDNITHFKDKDGLNEIENKLLQIHKGIRNNEKRINANKIFDVIGKEEENINLFLDDILKSDRGIFQHIDYNEFFKKLICLTNKQLLVFSNALRNIYESNYVEFPKDELPFFIGLKKTVTEYINSNDFKNPKKLVLNEFLSRIDKIIEKLNRIIANKIV